MDKIRLPFSELSFHYSRSSGAGGQNVNKVNSKVTLEWKIDTSSACPPDVAQRFKERFRGFLLDDGTVQITCQVHRSQKMNIDECISKLHAMLDEVLRPPKKRKPTKPKRSAVLKRLNSKKKDSEKKQMRRRDY